jgi:hypothetical protein
VSSGASKYARASLSQLRDGAARALPGLLRAAAAARLARDPGAEGFDQLCELAEQQATGTAVADCLRALAGRRGPAASWGAGIVAGRELVRAELAGEELARRLRE